MDAEKLANACERIFPLKDLTLSPSYSYDSLPLCLIDAVFSIGVKYTSTQNVVKHYCAYFKLNEFNMDREHTSNRHGISDFIKNIEAAGIEKSANEVFCNRQRTSSRNGILKAEAVLRIARIIQKDGVETFEDLRDHGLSEKAEAAIKQVPGQKSGLSLAYFYMLSGDDSLAKPDRHVLRFIAQHTGMTPNIQEAQKLLTDTVSVLSEKYPNLSVRLLDHSIWEYMTQDTQKPKAVLYSKLVRDRIPEMIDASGRTCITEILSEADYLRMVDAKLDEELAEYHENPSIEELADLMEVIYAAANARGYTLDQLEQARVDKAEKRGRFEKRILLVRVEEGQKGTNSEPQ